jgi:hypothetical protein
VDLSKRLATGSQDELEEIFGGKGTALKFYDEIKRINPFSPDNRSSSYRSVERDSNCPDME